MPFQIESQRENFAEQDVKQRVDVRSLLNRDLSYGKSFKIRDKSTLFSDLGMLLKSGLDLQSAFEMILEGDWKKKQRAFLTKLNASIISGSDLYVGFQQSEDFSPFEIFSIKIGENTGRLIHVFEELADFNIKLMSFRRQIVGAVSYPVFLIGFSVLVVYFMLKYLVPMFEGIFMRFDGELPMITRKLIDASRFVNEYFSYAIFLLAVTILLSRIYRKKPWLVKLKSYMMIRTPVIGPLVKKIYLARFCRSMYFLLESKIPLLNTIELVREMIPLYPISKSLDKIGKDILQGASLHESMAKHDFYPKQQVALVRVGEEAGNLELVFSRLSDQYNQEVEAQSNLLGKMLEPALIIVLGFFIGLILIAMYLPIFKLGLNA